MNLSDDINDYCFIDTETKALPLYRGTIDENVVNVGAYRYRRCAKVIIITYAIGDGAVIRCAFPDFDPTRTFMWVEGSLPPDLLGFHQRAKQGNAWYVAWNAAFDRLMLNTVPGCEIDIEMIIDCMCQAAASNLPGKLQGASLAVGRHGKQEDGKELIALFTTGDWETATPQTEPEKWARFVDYAGRDIDELRAVFKATRPLPRKEWEEYWVSERINDRGMAVDVEFCDRAAMIAELNREMLNEQVNELTGGKITKVTQRERIANWLFDNTTHNEAADTLVKAWTAEDEITSENDELVASKLSIAEDRLRAYVNFYEALDEAEGLTDEDWVLLQLADARLIGSSSTPGKFQKVVDMRDDDDRLKGQYTFNGAQQTGRFSSRGVQVHNLVRASLTDKEHPDREIEAIELINELEIDYA